MHEWQVGYYPHDFNIKHRKGRDSIVADILNRNPENTGNEHHIPKEQEINIKLQISKDCNRNSQQVGRLQAEDHKLNNIINAITTNQYNC